MRIGLQLLVASGALVACAMASLPAFGQMGCGVAGGHSSFDAFGRPCLVLRSPRAGSVLAPRDAIRFQRRLVIVDERAVVKSPRLFRRDVFARSAFGPPVIVHRPFFSLNNAPFTTGSLAPFTTTSPATFAQRRAIIVQGRR
jgi:hypothetical protein